MMRNVKDLRGYAIRATDGVLGTVDDFYFDDEDWGDRVGRSDAPRHQERTSIRRGYTTRSATRTGTPRPLRPSRVLDRPHPSASRIQTGTSHRFRRSAAWLDRRKNSTCSLG